MNLLVNRRNQQIKEVVLDAMKTNNMHLMYGNSAIKMIAQYAHGYIAHNNMPANEDSALRALRVAVNRFNKVNG